MALKDSLKNIGERINKANSLDELFDNKKDYLPQVRDAIGELVHSADPAVPEIVARGKSRDVAYVYLQQARAHYEEKAKGEIEPNLSSALDILDEEGLERVIFSTRPQKNVNAEHDKVSKLHEDYIKLSGEVKRGNISEYIGLIKSESVKKAVAYEASVNPQAVLHSFEQYVQLKRLEMLGSLSSNGKPDKSKMEEYIKRNVERSKDDEKLRAYSTIASQVASH